MLNCPRDYWINNSGWVNWLLCIKWTVFSYKIMEAIRNKVEKEQIDYCFQCWVYQENYCISCGIISLLFSYSKKDNINKDRWPFVLRLNKKSKNQFQMQQSNQPKHNEVTSCTIHDSWVHVLHKYTYLCQVLYIFMYYYQEYNRSISKQNKTKKLEPSDIIWWLL